MKSHCLIGLSMVAFFVLAGRAEPMLDLAVRGQPAAYTIVTRAQPSPVEEYAAEELQTFVEKTTGVKLPRQTDTQPLPARAIFVGEGARAKAVLNDAAFDPKALGEDGFRLAARPPHLVVWGSATRGALYGVYELLEKYAGCRWYASWHSVIPCKDRLPVPTSLDDTQTPAFLMRQPWWHDVMFNREFGTRLRVNGNHAYNAAHEPPVPAKFGPDTFRCGAGLGNSHTFFRLMPPNEFFATHPEYYSLVKGKRRRDAQLCLTNPDVLRIVTERVLNGIRKDPGAKFYGVSQMDFEGWCECPACAAIDKEEESHAGTVIRFVNAVAERVEKEFPNVLIETLAYMYTRKAPKKTKLRHNVVPCLCSIECDFARPIAESPCPQNIAFRKDIEEWSRQTNLLYLWDYTTSFNHYLTPFANVLSLQDNIKFFRDNHVKILFEQGDANGRHADFGELKTWLLSKFMWNPDQPLEPLLQDFFSGYYGKGAPFVRAYFDELHKRQRAWSADPKHPLTCSSSPGNPALSDDFLETAAGLWQQAIDATRDDPATSYNVRMGAITVDYAKLWRILNKSDDLVAWFDSAPPAGREHPIDDEKRRLARLLLARFDEAKNIALGWGSGGRIAKFRAILNAPVPKPLVAQPNGGVIEESAMMLHQVGKLSALVDDPLAADGRAVKILNTRPDWCVELKFGRIHFKPNQKYRLRARVRVEKEGSGEAFQCHVYNRVVRASVCAVAKTTDQTTNSYEWYDVGTLVPNDSCSFWMGAGRFESGKGKRAVKAVYLDRIEFVPVP